jgi:hypothetical protein
MNNTFANYTVVLGDTQSRGDTDSACVDLYTSALVLYEDVYLAFPSAYYHFRHTDPPRAPPSSMGKGNDGVLAVRLAWGRNSTANFSYLAEPEAEWIPRGVGRFIPEDWRFVGEFDSGHTFMTWGLLEYTSPAAIAAAPPSASPDWDKIVAYHHGSQLTHGGVDGWFTPGYHNSTTSTPIRSGIERLELRRDGFASLRLLAGVEVGTATVSATLPSCGGGWAQLLLLYADVPVGGAVRVGLNYTGFTLDTADEWYGNAVRRPVSWNTGNADVSSLAGLPVNITFHLVHSARVFAFELRCT